MGQGKASSEATHGSFKSYTIGFITSIVLTIIPILVVVNNWFDGISNTILLMSAAILQLGVQLLFFMHLREEKKPRYNLITLLLALLILILIVGGSIWIMMYNTVAT